jgi:hypothetical protein
MTHELHPKVAFVGWNPFQFVHFAPVIARVPQAEVIIEKKRGIWKSFDPRTLGIPAGRVHHLGPRRMRKLDGQFDVLVCQTPFTGIENLRRSRVAMLQYGYAKEAHNYGAWRSFADVCMTYGPYASRRIAEFAPCVATGNPRFEPWRDPEFHRRAREKHAAQLDPAKKTVLYAPTWGGLSSHGAFADAIAALSAEFNLLVKIHHISARFGSRPDDALRRKFPQLCGAEQDLVELLAVADVLLSDFSGAIFDAIQSEVPVVLLGPAATLGASSSDLNSLEQARRAELGLVAATPADLAPAVRRALVSDSTADAGLARLRAELFTDAAGASDRVAQTIRELARGSFVRTDSQSAMRAQAGAGHRVRNRFRTLKGLRRMFGTLWRRP